MEPVKPIVNKVTQRAIVTIDLEYYYPKPQDIRVVDIKDYLFKGLILREAEFRETVKQTDWSVYRGKRVAIYCSAHAIVPMWAYMILSAELAPYAQDIACSSPEHAPDVFLYRNLAQLDMNEYVNQRVVIKGCGDRQVPEAAYVQLTAQLVLVARVVMYGEPCSSVPVFKKSVD